MKLNGRKPAGPNVEIVVIPRPPEVTLGENGERQEKSMDLVFKCQAVLDFADLEKMCPMPKPPMIRKRGQDFSEPDFANQKYREQIRKRADQKTSFLIMKSLEGTPGLEWEKVKPLEPETWSFVTEELREAGLTDHEMSRILNGVQIANGLNEDRYKEAKSRFLATQEVQVPPAT